MKAFDQALKKASTRYHNTQFLAGYLQEDAQGWSSRWALTQAGIVVEWQTAAPTKAELMQTAVTRFADEWMKGARPAVTTAQVDAVTVKRIERQQYRNLYSNLAGLREINKRDYGRTRCAY